MIFFRVFNSFFSLFLTFSPCLTVFFLFSLFVFLSFMIVDSYLLFSFCFLLRLSICSVKFQRLVCFFVVLFSTSFFFYSSFSVPSKNVFFEENCLVDWSELRFIRKKKFDNGCMLWGRFRGSNASWSCRSRKKKKRKVWNYSENRIVVFELIFLGWKLLKKDKQNKGIKVSKVKVENYFKNYKTRKNRVGHLQPTTSSWAESVANWRIVLQM